MDVVVGNFGLEPHDTNLIFETPKRRGASLFDWGHILVEFRGDALAKWAKGDVKGKGYERLADGRLVITRSGAQIIGSPLNRGEFGTLHLMASPKCPRPMTAVVAAATPAVEKREVLRDNHDLA